MKRILTFLFVSCLLLVAVSAAELTTVKELNTVATPGSHLADDYKTASMEENLREQVVLNYMTTGYTEYNKAYYPRLLKLREDLYLLLFHGTSTGGDIFWTTSKDGVNWEKPQYFYDNSDKKIVLSDGPFDGYKDTFMAVNADAVQLKNGDILAAYTIRVSKGYATYPQHCGVVVVRGTISADGKITWGEHKQVYYGSGWEPFIWQREDGRIEIYWSNGSYHIRKYGRDSEHRSNGTGLIWSDDNGYTWTPNVQPGDTNYYQPFMVFSQFIGNKVHTEAPDLGELPWGCAQMPAATRLYDGRTLLAAEVKLLSGSFTLSHTVSGPDGFWEHDLQNGATTNGSDYRENYLGAGPYLATFPSGEVLMTYHRGAGSKFYYKMGSPDGKEFDSLELRAVRDGNGMWGGLEPITGHEIINVVQKLNNTTDVSGVLIAHLYLNHRTNAKKMTPVLDGKDGDWKDNTDALFVGSASQAQMTVQTAHDKDNVYFCINRLDNYLTDGDTVTLNIATTRMRFYRVEIAADGKVTVSFIQNAAVVSTVDGGKATVRTVGTVGNNEDTDEGVCIEFALPKALIGLQNASSFKLSPTLMNVDGDGAFFDQLNGVSSVITDRWPAVVLG